LVSGAFPWYSPGLLRPTRARGRQPVFESKGKDRRAISWHAAPDDDQSGPRPQRPHTLPEAPGHAPHRKRCCLGSLRGRIWTEGIRLDHRFRRNAGRFLILCSFEKTRTTVVAALRFQSTLVPDIPTVPGILGIVPRPPVNRWIQSSSHRRGAFYHGANYRSPRVYKNAERESARRFFVSPHVANVLATIGVILRRSLLQISRARSEQNPRCDLAFLDELRRTTQTLRNEPDLRLTLGPEQRTGSPFSRYVFRPTPVLSVTTFWSFLREFSPSHPGSAILTRTNVHGTGQRSRRRKLSLADCSADIQQSLTAKSAVFSVVYSETEFFYLTGNIKRLYIHR
jgi:hypothetical protein